MNASSKRYNVVEWQFKVAETGKAQEEYKYAQIVLNYIAWLHALSYKTSLLDLLITFYILIHFYIHFDMTASKLCLFSVLRGHDLRSFVADVVPTRKRKSW